MSEDASTDSAARRRAGTRALELDGKPYVLLTRSEYNRLRREAERLRPDAGPFASDSVGPDLRARRHGVGLTLSAVARRAGIAAETLSRIENGRTDPSVGTVRSILRALGAEA